MDLDSSAIGSVGINGLSPCIRMPPPSSFRSRCDGDVTSRVPGGDMHDGGELGKPIHHRQAVVELFPPPAYESWRPTTERRHRFTQVVGEVRLAAVTTGRGGEASFVMLSRLLSVRDSAPPVTGAHIPTTQSVKTLPHLAYL